MFSEISQKPGASNSSPRQFTSMASGMCPKPCSSLALESTWVSGLDVFLDASNSHFLLVNKTHHSPMQLVSLFSSCLR